MPRGRSRKIFLEVRQGLLDILKAGRLAVDFGGGLDGAGFQRDAKTQSAILHQLAIIGEAVKRLSPEFRSRCPAIPWKSVAGMRDKLIHAYDAVDLEEVWKIVTVELPHLIEVLAPLEPK